MSIGAELGQYILHTIQKKNLKIQWGRGRLEPSGYFSALLYDDVLG